MSLEGAAASWNPVPWRVSLTCHPQDTPVHVLPLMSTTWQHGRRDIYYPLLREDAKSRASHVDGKRTPARHPQQLGVLSQPAGRHSRLRTKASSNQIKQRGWLLTSRRPGHLPYTSCWRRWCNAGGSARCDPRSRAPPRSNFTACLHNLQPYRTLRHQHEFYIAPTCVGDPFARWPGPMVPGRPSTTLHRRTRLCRSTR